MTRIRIVGILAVALWLGIAAAICAQSGAFSYDPSAEMTVSGKILHIASFPAPDGAVGVHFDLQTADGFVNVHVAPAVFIGGENFSFFADDQVDIIGVKAFVDGNKSFIARSVTKDGKTLTLRGADGRPVWKPATEGVDGCGVEHPALPRGTELE